MVSALGADSQIESIVGIARRTPEWDAPKTEWRAADISKDNLTRHFEGADCVIHLAWLIQPSRDLRVIEATNIEGSRRVFSAVAEAGVGSLVYASSIGAYSPGDKVPVDESWPTEGIQKSFYSRHKAQTERMLDRFETKHPEIRVVRLRPGLIFKRTAATGIRRLFIGPFLPNRLVKRSLIPVVPDVERLVFQCVHTDDVAEAYRLAATTDVSGPFNIAAEPIIDPPTLARLLKARLVKVPERVLRDGAALTWRARLQPSPEGWVHMGYDTPLMDTSRATKELGWTPNYSAEYALLELLEGLREGAGFPTPPLDPATSKRFRIKEFITGIGARSGAE